MSDWLWVVGVKLAGQRGIGCAPPSVTLPPVRGAGPLLLADPLALPLLFGVELPPQPATSTTVAVATTSTPDPMNRRLRVERIAVPPNSLSMFLPALMRL